MSTTTSSTLDNGLLVIVNENSASSAIALQLVVRAGSAYEKEDEQGYAHILEHMLLKGTTRRPTSYDIGLEIDRIGAYSNASTAYEAAWFILEAASRHAEKLFDVMADNILNATLDARVLENEKKVILGEFRQRDNMLIRKCLMRGLAHYANNHPIARDPLGVEGQVLQANPDALRSYKEKYYVPANCALIISGAIDNNRASQLAEKYFGLWSHASAPDRSLPPPQFIHGGSDFLEHPADTTYLTLYYGIERAASLQEYAALDLIVSLLGYGYTSLILNELRNKRGLIYSSGTNARYYSNATVITIGTNSSEPEAAVQAIDEIVQNLEKRLSDSEIANLKVQVNGIIERQISNSEYVTRTLQQQFVQFGSIITPEDYLKMLADLPPDFVRSTCRLFFNPQKMFTFALGKKALVVQA